MTSAGSTPASDATERIVVRSKPWSPNCDRAMSRIAARVACPSRPSRAFDGMPTVYSTTVDTAGFKGLPSKSTVVELMTRGRHHDRYRHSDRARPGRHRLLLVGLRPVSGPVEGEAPRRRQHAAVRVDRQRRAHRPTGRPLRFQSRGRSHPRRHSSLVPEPGGGGVMTAHKVDVLVVGAGPTGLTAAGELAPAGPSVAVT